MSIYKTGRLASTANAQRLRKMQTDEETKLWGELRNRRFSAFKFRRQQPLGKYIADFCCHEYRLVVEIDGAHHDIDADRERDNFRQQAGYRIMRFSNYEINTNIDFVLENIWIALNDATFDPDK